MQNFILSWLKGAVKILIVVVFCVQQMTATEDRSLCLPVQPNSQIQEFPNSLPPVATVIRCETVAFDVFHSFSFPWNSFGNLFPVLDKLIMIDNFWVDCKF